MQRRDEVRLMEYPKLGDPGAAVSVIPPVIAENRVRELEDKLVRAEGEFDRRLQNAKQEAVEMERRQAGNRLSVWREECAAQVTAAIEAFRGHRDAYLARVEHEVVRLALAVAERILHREAQVDPLLLSGAVRVALGQLASSTEVRLRVPAEQKEMWEQMVRLMPGLPLRPEVLGDEQLEPGEAILEASVGTVDLSVQAQMEEVRRSFFDGAEAQGKGTGEAPTADAAGAHD